MRFLPCLTLLLAAPVAHAQILSIYGTFSDTHLSGLVNGTAGNALSGYTATTTGIWTPGFGVGATFGVIPLGPIRLGLDVRTAIKPGNNGSDLVLAGPRLALRLPLIRVKPYIQASGGYVRTSVSLANSPLPTGTQEKSNYAAYEILGGLDYPLVPFFDFRVIEIGGGQGYSFSGSAGTGNSVSLFSISTGAVFHF